MAQPRLTRLTEKQHKQLKCWLWDVDRTTLRYTLEKICDMDPNVAVLAYEQAHCKDYEVVDDRSDLLGIPSRTGGDRVEQVSGAAPSAFSLAAPGNGSEVRSAFTTALSETTTATTGTRDTGPSVPVTSIPTDAKTGTYDQGKMSLASLLQPSTTPKSPVRQAAPIEIHVQPRSDSPANKKRKLDHSPRRRLVICKKCGCPYDVHKDGDQLCIFHPGAMERDEEAWEDIDDYGSISDRDHQMDEPELYTWSCCGKNGEELGCQRGRHRRNGAQSIYAELRVRRGGDQGTDTESSDS